MAIAIKSRSSVATKTPVKNVVKSPVKTIVVTPIASVKRNPTKIVSLDLLKTNFFVRVTSNEDRILQFAMLFESEGLDSLPPIKVNQEMEIIDGRHRFEALKLANKTQAKVEIINESDEGNLLFMAFEANMGGALPPEGKDIEMTMRKLLQQGWTRATIIQKFKPFIGSKAAQERINWAQSHLNKMKTENALRAIRDESLTVPQAAEMFNVKIETLREAMGGKKPSNKENRIGKIKAELKAKYRGANATTGQYFKILSQDLHDGVLTVKEMNDFTSFTKSVLRDQLLRIDEWEKRIAKFV